MNLETKLKDKAKYLPGSFIEFARFKDGYLFDEIHIKKFEHIEGGALVTFSYTRLGNTIFDMQPVSIPPPVFADARAKSEGDKQKFAETDFVKRLFADAARQYLERHKTAEVDFFKDMEFIERLKED